MDRIDAVVIGAGVVGLACARALAQQGLETVILERHDAFGTETSARNSEVIHAGLYYPTGSRKAQLCVAGHRSLYEFCQTHGVNHHRCGKLVVATSVDQEALLLALQEQGRTNGLTELQWLNADQALALEPALHCTAALLSPTTGIIDSHGLMLVLLGDAERHGAVLALRSPLRRGRITSDGIALDIGGTGSGHVTQLLAGIVINSAGLSAPQVATSFDGFPSTHVPTGYYAKGNYFALTGRPPFSHLIYPLPEPGGLGVHLTLDLGGQARFGPDVEWIAEPDYNIDPARAAGFYRAVRRYWPDLPDEALTPAFAGIRPKIAGAQDSAADFLIQGPPTHGVPGLVNLFGIESPGLTACLAIADSVAALVNGG
jgi:L-2-hydroxyglutarate oxidase LhgO